MLLSVQSWDPALLQRGCFKDLGCCSVLLCEFYSLTVERRETRMGGRGGGIRKIPESHFFPFVSSLTMGTNKLQPTSLNDQQAPSHLSWLQLLYTLRKVPRMPNITQSRELSAAGKKSSLSQSTRQSQLISVDKSKQSHIPHLGLKQKHNHIAYQGFKRNQNFHYRCLFRISSFLPGWFQKGTFRLHSLKRQSCTYHVNQAQ